MGGAFDFMHFTNVCICMYEQKRSPTNITVWYGDLIEEPAQCVG